MTDPVERVVNLAYYLADQRHPVSINRIRAEVTGYSEDQDDAAFNRMFERDKDDLRRFGFVIDGESDGRYRLDGRATFASSTTLSPEEAATLRVVCAALLDDPAFPFAEDLRFALVKLSVAGEGQTAHGDDIAAVSRLADEDPEFQGVNVSALDEAVRGRKTVEFDYTNSRGEDKHHTIEPYGLFAHSGRWYVVGRDRDLGEVRTYCVSRLAGMRPNARAPRTPDFERPADFDVAAFTALPFQYGSTDPITVRLSLTGDAARRSADLCAGKGTLSGDGDALTWEVDARDTDRLLCWVIENGPGIRIVEPASLAADMGVRLSALADSHGRHEGRL